MFDKIQVYTKDFQIKQPKAFIVDYGRKNLETDIYCNKLIYFNNEKVKNAFLNKKAKKNEYELDIDFRGLTIKFNPNKVNFSNNYRLSDNQDLIKSVETIKNEIKDYVSFNIEESKLTRIDLTKDIKTKRYIFEYQPIFENIKAKRMKSKQYEEGFTVGNNSREICFYDKKRELIEVQKIDIEKINKEYKNFNLLRGELRLKTQKTIQNNLNIEKLKDCYKQDNYFELQKKYKLILSDIVFKKKNESQLLLFDLQPEIERLKYFKQKYARNSIYKYLLINDLNNIIIKFGNINNFGNVLESIGYDRSYVYRIKIELEKQLQENKYITNRFQEKKINITELYNELYEKFCI